MTMPIPLNRTEKRSGSLWLAFYFAALPVLLSSIGAVLRLEPAQLNLYYYWINFAGVLWIFRRFLLGNLLVALDRVFPVIWCAILGYLGYETLGELLTLLTWLIDPDFVNMNDTTVSAMVRSAPMLALTIAVIVPIGEETLFRGLIFRGLWEKNHTLAYLVSIAAFAAAHVVGYIGILSPLQLLLSFVQYLPAGYCLAFSYRRCGTIFCPILIHIAVNTVAVYAITR